MDSPELLDVLMPSIANIPGRASDVPRMQALLETVNVGLLEAHTLGLFGPSTTGIAQRVRSGRAVSVELARAILFDRARRAGRLVPQGWLGDLDALDSRLTQLAASEFPELARPEGGPAPSGRKPPFEGWSRGHRTGRGAKHPFESGPSRGQGVSRGHRRNPVLAFTLASDGTAMARVLGARCHLLAP